MESKKKTKQPAKKPADEKEPKTKPHVQKVGKKKNLIKYQINNEVIQFQGKFKQAKVGAVRKLVDKLKNPEKNAKQNRAAKAERYQNVLNELKHMAPKRLGLLALLYHKSGKNYLADQNSTAEQLAVGYFYEYKGVAAMMDTMKNKLKLNESSNWKSVVRKLFKKKDKSEKGEKSEKGGRAEKTPKAEKKAAAENGKETKKKSKTKQMPSDSNVSVKSDEAEESDEESESSDSEDSNESEEDVAPTTVDDFFITADGSNYLSTAIVSKKQQEDSDGEEKVFAKKLREASFFHKSDKKPAVERRTENSKRKWPKEEEQPAPAEKVRKVDTSLHPSWQAKQKQKPTIANFTGTKITFD